MTVIEDIKARLDLVDFISSCGITLKRAGRSYTGMCPFHDNHHTPAFVVFPDSQTWRCFGQCDTGGDLFAYVMKRDGLDFKEALRVLAEKAGVELKPLNQAEQKRAELRRTREEVLGKAMDFFRKQMAIPDMLPLEAGQMSPALEYAVYTRGWDLETVRAAGMGYFGKDWNGLREHLQGAGIDLEAPAAVALIGYRGDVGAWAKKWGMESQVAKAWIEDGKIPAIRAEMLIYAHSVRGRIGYLAGRGIFEKFHRNLRDLDGQGGKEVYFNHVWWGRQAAKYVVVVEGQADAESLGMLGVQAVALAGINSADGKGEVALFAPRAGGGEAPAKSSSDNYLLSELKRKAGEGAMILIGLDAEEKVDKNRLKLVRELMDEGIKCTQIATVSWETKDYPGCKDANKLLTSMLGAGLSHEAMGRFTRGLLATAPSVLVERVKAAKEDLDNDDLARAVFDALVGLDPFEMERVKDFICTELTLSPRRFDTLLKAARRDAGKNDDGQPRYFVEGGRIFCRYTDSQGGEVLDALCNFAAEIKGDVMRDNGQETLREFHIHGSIGKKNLAVAQVKADEFQAMNWPLSAWGSQAIIEAGGRRKDQLRAAIQHLSKDVERLTIYTHTGWRQMDGRRVFLSSTGAVNAGEEETIHVELERELELYAIPTSVEDPKEAMELSLDYLGIGPESVTFPLWAATYAAPLRELVNLGFALWVYGGSGAMKSTAVALAMNHYGAKFDDKHLPASFMDTANRLEQKAFILKDCVFVIDDYAPQKDNRDAAAYRSTAHRIVRGAGNIMGRGRLASDSSARTTYVPRSLIIITGEDVPVTESFAARLFVVEMRRGDIDKKKLSDLQKKKERLSHAMGGYLSWAGQNWETLSKIAPEGWEVYRQKAFQPGLHLRIPEAVAGLMVGLTTGLEYAAYVGAIGRAEASALQARGWDALMAGAKSMSERVRDEKADQLFVRTLKDWLTQGKICLRPKDGGAVLGGLEEKTGVEMLGWYDGSRYYLLPEATYSRLARHAKEQGETFPVSEHTLRKSLAESGTIDLDTEGRRTFVIRVDDKMQRVLAVRRNVVDGQAEPELPTQVA